MASMFCSVRRVTYHMVRRAIFSLWSCVLLLVLLPLAGFGLYFDPSSKRCVRYRQATEPREIAYAYVYFTFGLLLIAGILCFNLLVMRRLCHGQVSWGRGTRVCRGRIGVASSGGNLSVENGPGAQVTEQGLLRAVYRPASEKNFYSDDGVPRRFSRASSRQRLRARTLQHTESVDSATHEETAFAKLMAFLCVLFVLCWLPQMIAIPLTQLWPSSRTGQLFTRAADFSLLLHFTIDPFVYVLQRCTRRHHRHRAPAPPPLLLPPEPSPPQTPLKRLCATAMRLCSCCSCRHDAEKHYTDHSLTHYNSSATRSRSNPHLNSVAL